MGVRPGDMEVLFIWPLSYFKIMVCYPFLLTFGLWAALCSRWPRESRHFALVVLKP